MTVQRYDIMAACQTLFQGLVVQQPLLDAAEAQWIANGQVPLGPSDVTIILAAANVLVDDMVVADYVPTTEPDYPTTLPAYPTGMPRWPDAYGGMDTPDGWTKVAGGKVVRP